MAFVVCCFAAAIIMALHLDLKRRKKSRAAFEALVGLMAKERDILEEWKTELIEKDNLQNNWGTLWLKIDDDYLVRLPPWHAETIRKELVGRDEDPQDVRVKRQKDFTFDVFKKLNWWGEFD